MFSFLQKLSAYKTNRIQLVIVIVSVLVASQVQYIQHGWINPDSVLYLEAAKLFAVGQWKSGFEIFPWPFYSLWIAATHKLTNLSIHHTAQLLNVFFFAIATYAFTSIIQLCGGKQKELIAGGLIFLSAQYMIGGVLEMLMRDEGFWAFFLSSLVFFIRFHQHHQLKDALLWQVAIIFAMLFRIEAILYLVLLPLVLLLNTHHNLISNIKLAIKAYSIQISLALIAITALLIHPELSFAMFGRLNEIFTTDLLNEFTEKIIKKSQLMSTLVLGEYLEEFAVPGLILTFLYVIVVKTINATGIVTLGLGILGVKHYRTLVNQKGYQILMVTMLIALLNMAIIITKVFVLSGRYVLAISFIIMVLASFYFAKLLQESENSTSKQSRWLVSILLIVMALGFIKNLIPKQDGYNYMQDAVVWLESNNPANPDHVFFNETRLRHYANAPFAGTWSNNLTKFSNAITDGSINHYQFLMIATTKRELVTITELNKAIPNYKEIKRFHDTKSKKFVIIYKRLEH